VATTFVRKIVPGLRGAVLALLLVWVLVPAPGACGREGTAEGTGNPESEPGKEESTLARELIGDVTYAARSAYLDARSILLSPLSIPKLRKITWKQVAVGVLAAGAITGTVFLDERIRDTMKKIPDGTARSVQTASTAALWAGLGCLYIGGVIKGERAWRHTAITGLESYPASFGIARGIKGIAGRLRPYEERGAYEWREGGDSFVSDATAPAFALAAVVSHAFEDRWWALLPAYGAAMGVGVGRMGQDKHWASDILGSAAVGVCTSKAFLKLHESREADEAASVAPPPPQAGLGPVFGPGGGRGFGVHIFF